MTRLSKSQVEFKLGDLVKIDWGQYEGVRYPVDFVTIDECIITYVGNMIIEVTAITSDGPTKLYMPRQMLIKA